MTFETVFLASALLLPLIVRLLSRRPEALFLAASAVFLVFGLLLTGETGLRFSRWSHTDTAYHDTLYVVALGNYWRNLGIGMFVLFAITWLQSRLGALVFPRTTKFLFWLLHLGLLVRIGLPEIAGASALSQRQFVEAPDFVSVLNLWDTVAKLVVVAAALGLIGMSFWSFYRNWASRKAP